MKTGGRSVGLARLVSTLGHPALTITAAALVLAAERGGLAAVARPALVLATISLSLVAISVWQVRRGAWVHIDASAPSERRTMNRMLAAGLALGAAVAFAAGEPQLAAGLLAGGAIIAAAVLLSSKLKLSQHVAFAVYAALIVGEARGAGALIAAAGLVALIAWSRLKLQRHGRRDLVAGALAGAAAWLLWRGLTQGPFA